MALTEQTTLKSVEIDYAASAANVLWIDAILRDGVTISENLRRKSYGKAQSAEFVAEVAGASVYLPVLGW